ncbi:MAG: protein translocase subunit SecD [Firmicutes bacterium]|nr:protein translocase subunit SecD [Bacillota bacterium]
MWKKVVSVLLILVIALGLVVTLNGVKIGDLDIPNAKDNVTLGLDLAGGAYVVMEAQTDATGDDLDKLMEQTQAVIENRVNEMGLSEPTVTVESDNRIRVEMPGAEDAQDALAAIGRTAQLQFIDAWGNVVVDGSHVKDAVFAYNNNGSVQEPGISVTFDAQGADAFYQATVKAMGNKGTKQENKYGTFDCGQILIVLDDEVISAPMVQSEISGGSCFISGSYTQETAAADAALIRGGSLPVELKEINTSIVGATLGYESFEKALKAGIIGILLIMLFMIIVYKIMGVAASVALLLYTVIYLAIFQFFGAVITLPGIFGILLSIGMAVDANVIIFARIREEIKSGKSVRVAVRSGFSRATSTIIDSNITTLIAGIVLYQFGTGSVKGFAWTLMVGIIISMLTALLVTRLFIIVLAESKAFGKESFFMYKTREKDLSDKKLPVISKRKFWYAISLCIILLGFGLGVARGFNMGIDFTGGTMMQIDMGKSHADLTAVEQILDDQDIKATIVYAGDDNDEIIIRTATSLDNDAREVILDQIYDKYGLDSEALMAADQFGPSVGAEIQKSALQAVFLACILMLIYIAIRFELNFGIAAILALLVDVLTMISLYGLFHIEINSPFIAAVLIILGYSINNTIVVFDRIRENMKYGRVHGDELVDLSVRQTLSRTISTSVTTILAVVALLILGTPSLRSYVLPVMMGLIAGTYSSIFVSGSIWYDISRLVRSRKGYQGKKKSKKTYKGKEKSKKEPSV